MTRSSGGPVSNSAVSAARAGWTIAPISSTAATMAGAWSHDKLTVWGAMPGAVKIGLQHAFGPMPVPPGAASWRQRPPPQQSTSWSESASARAASDAQHMELQTESWSAVAWLFPQPPAKCRQTSLSRPLAHTHAVLGKPAHRAKGIIPQAMTADKRVRKKLIAKPRSSSTSRAHLSARSAD